MSGALTSMITGISLEETKDHYLIHIYETKQNTYCSFTPL